MASNPSATRTLRKKRKDRFYRLLSERCNYMDETSIAHVYLALVAVILDELKSNKVVTLPLLGDMQLVEQKSRMAWVGKTHALIGPRDILKFRATDDIKRYLSKKQGPAMILRTAVYRGTQEPQ